MSSVSIALINIHTIFYEIISTQYINISLAPIIHSHHIVPYNPNTYSNLTHNNQPYNSCKIKTVIYTHLSYKDNQFESLTSFFCLQPSTLLSSSFSQPLSPNALFMFFFEPSFSFLKIKNSPP